MIGRKSFRVLAGFGALDQVAEAAAEQGIQLDPVLVDADDRVEWQGRRMPVQDAAPEIGWYSPELFASRTQGQFLKLAADAGSLSWLQSARAGTNDPGLSELARAGVRITTSDAPAIAIAEYVMAQVLDHFQRGPERRAAQAAARWEPFPFREILGSTWVIFGFGAIGRATAQRARAFGAHVTGVTRSATPDPQADRMLPVSAIGDALAAADVVVLSVPLTRETIAFADRRFFAALKPGAVVVNVGRGGLVDESALREALDSGQTAHAILDVTTTEPLPPAAWQWRHPGVTLTAHTSGRGSGMLARTRSVFVENLRRFATQQPLRNEVSEATILASAEH